MFSLLENFANLSRDKGNVLNITLGGWLDDVETLGARSSGLELVVVCEATVLHSGLGVQGRAQIQPACLHV